MGVFLNPIGSAVEVIGLAASLGTAMELLIGPRPKVTVRRLIRALTQRSVSNISYSFIQCFDSLFDSSRRGRPRIWRSLVASCLALTITTIYWLHSFPDRAVLVLALLLVPQDTWPFLTPNWSGVGLVASFVVIINVVGDILSMWETRFLMGHLANSQSSIRQIALLITDVIFSILIYLVLLSFAMFLLHIVKEFNVIDYFTELRYIMIGIFNLETLTFRKEHNEGMDFLIICLYTSMLTSVWLWLFTLGIKIAAVTQLLLGPFARNLLWARYPVLFVMFMGGSLTGFVVMIVGWTGY